MQVFAILINENYLSGLMRKPVSCLSYRPLRFVHRLDLLVSRTRTEFTIILCESFSASYNWSAIRFVPCQPTKLPPVITDKFLFCLSYKGEWVLYALCLRKVVYEDKGPTCVPQRKERINVGYACDDV